MFSFIGLEQGKTIIEEYNREILYPMLLKCCHRLHPLFKNANVDQSVDKYCSLDIFEMTSTNELVEFLNKLPLIFKRFQMDVKDIKCPF